MSAEHSVSDAELIRAGREAVRLALEWREEEALKAALARRLAVGVGLAALIAVGLAALIAVGFFVWSYRLV